MNVIVGTSSDSLPSIISPRNWTLRYCTVLRRERCHSIKDAVRVYSAHKNQDAIIIGAIRRKHPAGIGPPVRALQCIPSVIRFITLLSLQMQTGQAEFHRFLI